jgi:hypothetical protein
MDIQRRATLTVVVPPGLRGRRGAVRGTPVRLNTGRILSRISGRLGRWLGPWPEFHFFWRQLRLPACQGSDGHSCPHSRVADAPHLAMRR